MAQKPITISPELAAKYAEPGQFEAFDAAFSKIATLPAETVAEVVKGSKGKPNAKGKSKVADS